MLKFFDGFGCVGVFVVLFIVVVIVLLIDSLFLNFGWVVFEIWKVWKVNLKFVV